MPLSATYRDGVRAKGAAAGRPRPAVRASAMDLAKAHIIADLRRDRLTLRMVYLAQLVMLLFLACVSAAVAVTGVVTSLRGMGPGFSPTDLKKVVEVLATGSASLLGVCTIRLLERFHRRGQDWMSEERRLTQVRNQVRLGDSKRALRAILAEYHRVAAPAKRPRPAVAAAPGASR